MSRRRRPPDDPYDRAFADPRVAYLPIRHHSPGSGWHVAAWIREHRPVAVLIEGPDDAGELLPHLLDERTQPPVAVLSVFVDQDEVVHPHGPEGPARFRALWPLVGHGPEWQAMVAARELGAAVRLIDAPYHVLVKSLAGETPDAGRAQREVAWYEHLARRTGRASFEDLFDATFEARAHAVSSEQWFRELAWIAHGARGDGDDGLDRDGTLLREAHMAWHVAATKKAFPDGRIAVVTGAFHAVALAATKPHRAKAKGTKGVRVVLAATSYPSLHRLAGVPSPTFGADLFAALGAGVEDPPGDAALRGLVRVAAALRDRGHPIGTADAVGAVQLARGLAQLRGGGPTPADVLEVARTAFVRGDPSGQAAVRAIATDLAVGSARGSLPPGAGRPPLTEDFYAEAKRNRIDLSGEPKVMRCDVLRDPAHRARSAFLHRASYLHVPMFDPLPDGHGPAWFKGADPLREEGEHLLGETWGVQFREVVDDHLLELSDRGTTLAEVASASLARDRAQAGVDLRRRVGVVVAVARMQMAELLPDTLRELGSALATSARFEDRVYALRHLLALHTGHESLPTFGADSVAEITVRAYVTASLGVPELARLRPEEADAAVDDLITLLRASTSIPGLDREVLLTGLRALTDGAGTGLARGAAAGGRAALGDLGERALADLAQAAFRGVDVHAGAAFLEGVLRTSRSALLGGRRLFGEVHQLLARLPPDVFRAVLPDLRRAFAVFVPAEIETLGRRVADRLAPRDAEPPLDTPAVRARAAEVDAAVEARFARRP